MRGIILAYRAGRSASGRMPARCPPSRATTMESRRSSARCFHHEDNHSCVRNTQSDALPFSSAFQESRRAKNSSGLSIVSIFISTSPISQFDLPQMTRQRRSDPDESESQARDAAETGRPNSRSERPRLLHSRTLRSLYRDPAKQSKQHVFLSRAVERKEGTLP